MGNLQGRNSQYKKDFYAHLPCAGILAVVSVALLALSCRCCASWRLRGAGVRRPKAEAGREFLGALQRSFALFETGTMIPEVIGKDRIALDHLSTAGTFFPLECIAELEHTSSSLGLSLASRRGRGALVSRGLRERRAHTRPT